MWGAPIAFAAVFGGGGVGDVYVPGPRVADRSGRTRAFMLNLGEQAAPNN